MVVQNPNNWHWVDKNCLPWAQEYFTKHLTNVSSSGVVVDAVKSLTGDCEVCQRKGKVISLYDLALTLTYKSDDHNGEITVPEIMYDTEPQEYQFSLDARVPENIRVIIRAEIVPKLRQLLSQFGKDLIQTHGRDIQVGLDQVESTLTKENANLDFMKPVIKEKTLFNTTKKEESKALPKYAQGYNITSLHIKDEFNTTAEQLFQTLLDPQRVMAWTRAPVEGLPSWGANLKNCEFRLFGGGVECKVLEANVEKSVIYWRLANWKAGHYVKITFTFKQGESQTDVEADLDGVPIGEEETVEAQFKERYFHSWKVVFGFGAVL